MAISFEHLCSVLDTARINYRPYDETTLLTVFTWEQLRVELVCSLWEEGEYLDVRTVKLRSLSREDPEHLAAALPLISQVNYNFKLARVAWEESGELTVGASLPIEDQEQVSPEQVAGLISAVCQASAELQRVLDAPEDADPEEPPSTGDLGLAELGRLLGGLGLFMLGLAALVAAAAMWLS